MRLHIIGTTGSGKSTLAAQLAAALACPHVELDDLFWSADWIPVTHELFLARIDAAVAGEAWVIDGNYHGALGTRVWTRADTVVWLDLPLPVNLWRLMRRSVRRAARKELLWNSGNQEDWRRLFLSRDSILLYALRTHARRRAQYETLIADPAQAHIRFVRLTSPHAARAWAAELITVEERDAA